MSPQPFDKEKYERLLGGLECSEIKFKELDEIQSRFDAEFYKKDYLRIAALYSKISTQKISALDVSIDCSAFYPGVVPYYNFDGKGVPFIRVNEIQNGLIRFTDNTAFLPKWFLTENSSCMATAYPWDIVIAKGGNTLAKVGILDDTYSEYAVCRDVLLLRTENLSSSYKYYLWAYLGSKYGQNLMWRTASQTGQPHLTVAFINDLDVPCFSNKFYDSFQNLYLESVKYEKSSVTLYKKAEELLSSSLGISSLSNDGKVSIKSFANSYKNSGRLDAEYYQPKYDYLFQQINNCKRVMSLGDIVKIKKSIEPGSDAYIDSGVPFLRVSDVSKYEIRHPEIYLDEKSYDLSNLIPRKDTILLSKDGSVGIAYKVQEDMAAVTSSALLHLQIISDEVLPDYLTLILNSFIVKMQAERDAGGSILQHWRIADIEKVQIPVADMDCQKHISETVQESFAMRARAKTLLDIAIRAVEIAIENGEEAALLYLDDCMEL